ncbi:Tetratricopeptide repeat superfamily protein [Perilla frutescens var. hirtella]|uniref:Tetratricopeptide repeat superfamily protein n=1 Tax=Perilla frutescens var. hirtella TaxID=608512 RepID=A0AAD4JL82_PERFH|nr:Tetratricopeptide repeat superfamily protein [Perilla frutescens var. hirtella]
MSATKEFKEVLTMRTENLKVHDNRRQLFSSSASKSNSNPFVRQRPLAAKSSTNNLTATPLPWSNGEQTSSQLFPKGEIFHTINRLRRLKSTKRALEVMEWVIREMPYGPKELDYSYLLEFTMKFHGVAQAIPKILTQMKADKVTRHVSTYNILMKVEANDHNIEGLVKGFGDMKRMMVDPNEISYCIFTVSHAVARLYTACEAYVEVIKKSMTRDNWSTLDILVILYGYLGDRKELERTWSMIEELPYVRGKSFLLAIQAFRKIGNLGRAEGLWHEMVSKKGLKSTEQFNSMIDMEKSGCKPNAIKLQHLALGCSRAGLLKETTRTLELGLEFIASVKINSMVGGYAGNSRGFRRKWLLKLLRSCLKN